MKSVNIFLNNFQQKRLLWLIPTTNISKNKMSFKAKTCHIFADIFYWANLLPDVTPWGVVL
jgi:hypothetical protein